MKPSNSDQKVPSPLSNVGKQLVNTWGEVRVKNACQTNPSTVDQYPLLFDDTVMLQQLSPAEYTYLLLCFIDQQDQVNRDC